MPFDDEEKVTMDWKMEILFWTSVPFLLAFMFIIMVPFLLDHLIRRYVVKQKGITAWEWFGQDEWANDIWYDYDNEDEKMFHGNPSEHFKKDNKDGK